MLIFFGPNSISFAKQCGIQACIQWRRNEFESGGTDPAQKRRKFFLVVPLHFLTLKAQLVVLVSAFMMVSTVWSVSCLLFFYSWCPRAQPFVKVGGTCPPPVPWSRRHCLQYNYLVLLYQSL